MPIKNIVIGCDHRGYNAKSYLVTKLEEMSLNVIDVGTNSIDSVDYPNFAKEVDNTIKLYKPDEINGVLLCGSGIGMMIAANKISQQVRAALIYNEIVAKTCKNHNNANVACFATDHFSNQQILSWLLIYLNSTFDGGRHQDRLNLINKLSC